MMTEDTISAKRKNDAVVKVCQDNQKKMLKIESMNRAAEKLTGYRQIELVDKALQKLLPDEVNDLIEGFIDYSDMGGDLATVLRKVRDFRVLNRNGEDIPVNLKIFYVLSEDSAKPTFELLMRNMTLLHKLEELKRQVVARQGKGDVYDANTGLLRESVIIDSLTHIRSFISNYMLEVSFGVISVDHVDKIASKYRTTVDEIMRKVGEKVAKVFRGDDIIGCTAEHFICSILFDCSTEDAQKAFNRAKSVCERQPITLENGTEIPVKISASYLQVNPDLSPQAILERCKHAVVKAQQSGGDRIYEAVE